MKKILYIISLLIVLPGLVVSVRAQVVQPDPAQPSLAQPDPAQGGAYNGLSHGSLNNRQISYDDVCIRRSGSFVDISFEVTATAKSVRRGEQLLLTPVLYNENRKVILPSIAVQSRRTELQAFRAGVRPGAPDALAYIIHREGKILYSTKIAYDQTLSNLFLRIERTEQRCTRVRTLAAIVLTDRAALVPEKVYTPHYTLPVWHPSVADSLSAHYSFVAPLSDFERSRKSSGEKLFDPNMPLNMGKGLSAPQQSAVEQFIEGNEKGAIQINFSRGGTTIDRFYKQNNASLVTLASVLKQIQQSGDSRIDKVVVAGFASPDGPLESNDRLAWGRAYAVREFIRNNSTIAPKEILLYNGSEDWHGLYELVAKSDIEAKHEVLYIINSVPILAGREKQLMDLAGGRPYKFMERYLFPQLRNAAYIKLYYNDTRKSAPHSENLHKAVALMDKGDYRSALRLLAGESDTSGGVLENLIGVCYMMSGDTSQGADNFRQAIDKGNTDAPLNLEQLSPMAK